MQETLKLIASKILPHGDQVVVTEHTDEFGNLHLTLITHPDDIGLAIGKGGKTVNAMRELLKIQAVQQGIRLFLDVRSSEEDAEPTTESAPATANNNEPSEQTN